MAKFSKLWNNHYNDAHLYVMGHADFPNAHKIGIATDPTRRAKDIDEKIILKQTFKKLGNRDFAELIEHLAQMYALVKYGQFEPIKYDRYKRHLCSSGHSEWFNCSHAQASGCIAQAYKKVYSLNFDKLALAKECVTYSRKKGIEIPDDMARWKCNAQSFIFETELNKYESEELALP